jgi:nucleoid-associated protein YgaU
MRLLLHSRGGLKTSVLVSLILGCAAASFAQDLGAIARQERERRKEQPRRSTYIYTNDDLHRQHILVPEDQARVLAAHRDTANPAVQVSQTPAPGAPAVVAAAVRPIATAASPAPIATAVAPVSTPVAADPAAPVAHSPVSARAVTVEPKLSPLEAIRQLVQEASVQERPATRPHRHARPVIAYIPFGARPSPAAQAKPVRRESLSSPVSRAVFSRPQPVDLGVADVVTVERGDSLWVLAKRYLGAGRRWRELATLNTQILNPNVLHVGEWICLPPGDVQIAQHERITPRARAPAATPETRVLVTPPSAAFAMQIANHRPLRRP